MFEWLKENPEHRKYFDSYMAGRRSEMLRWFEIYPVAGTLATNLRSGPKDVFLVDIGASQGHDLIRFKEICNKLPGRLILQDLPETIESLQNLPPGIEPMAYDFFTPQPITGESPHPEAS